MEQKKKRKVQPQQIQEEQPKGLIGSAEYLADHKFDRTIKTMQTNILQHNQSKKLEIIRTAQVLENQGYPITKICDRMTKGLQGPKYETSGSYVRKVLPEKYKDQDQMATAFQQNQSGDTRYPQQEQLRKKDVKEYTIEDSKHANLTQLRKAYRQKFSEAEWWKLQTEQNQNKEDKDQIEQQDNNKGDSEKKIFLRMRKFLATLLYRGEAVDRKTKKKIMEYLEDEGNRLISELDSMLR